MWFIYVEQVLAKVRCRKSRIFTMTVLPIWSV